MAAKISITTRKEDISCVKIPMTGSRVIPANITQTNEGIIVLGAILFIKKPTNKIVPRTNTWTSDLKICSKFDSKKILPATERRNNKDIKEK
jgi:hypothetical protein